MIPWLLAVVAGVAAALLAYPPAQWGAAGTRRTLIPLLAAARAAAAMLVVALLLGAPRAPARPLPPLVAVDASASWTRAVANPAAMPARLQAVTDSIVRAAAGGAGTPDVVWLGDSLRAADGSASGVVLRDQASRVRPAVDLANATGRALWLLSDGEIDDPQVLAEAPPGSRWVLPAREPRADLAVAALELPQEVRAGDTVTAGAQLVAGGAGAPGGSLEWLVDGAVVATAVVGPTPPWGSVRVSGRWLATRGESTAMVAAALAVAGDLEPRNDTLRGALPVVDRPPVVVVSSAPDLDVREVLRVLRGTLRLPAEAYLRVAPGQWRVEGTLTPIQEGMVRQRVRDAAVLLVHGDTAWIGAAGGTLRGAARALWRPAPPPGAPRAGELAAPGEWFVAPPIRPLRGGPEVGALEAALAGLPTDSLPPIALPAPGDTLALRGGTPGPLMAARLGKRGPPRPVVTADQRGGRREVRIEGSGYAGWALRGGRGGEAFTALWGGLLDWLAAGRADPRAAVPALPAFRAGDPIRWRRGGTDSLVTVRLTPVTGDGAGARPAATAVQLRFGATGREADSPPLPPGVWEAELPGGRARLVVNPSREWVPRPPVVPAAPAPGVLRPAEAPRLVEAGWPFVLILLLLSAEWIGRRFAGYR